MILVVGIFFISSCGLVTIRPKLEMSLAAAAFKAARRAEAAKHTPNLFRQAEDTYIKAKSAYRRKYFNKAKEYADLSRKFSERAEYAAKRKKTLESY